MRINNVINIIAAGTIMNATINSNYQQLSQQFGYAIQLVWTGTPTGTFKLQGSADTHLNPPVNWTDIANSSQAVSAAGNYMYNVIEVMYNYVRVVYTDGSGGASTAIITQATFNSKGV